MKYIYLMRPKHYIKNVLIFLPLFFSGKFLSVNSIITVVVAFFCFSFIASSIYILNDIKDKEKDKQHPTKCKRLLASGKVSIFAAIVLICFLILVTAMIIYLMKMPLVAICFLLLYIVINIFYSFGMKNIPIIDVFIVVCGFILRILYGAALFNIEVSNWLYLTILSISFYFALGKRRGEIVHSGEKSREVLKFYNQEFLDKNMYMFLSMAIVFYSLWATDGFLVSETNNLLIWTIPFIILICMKYSLIIEGNCDGDPINVIFKDKILILLMFILIIMLFYILYFSG